MRPVYLGTNAIVIMGPFSSLPGMRRVSDNSPEVKLRKSKNSVDMIESNCLLLKIAKKPQSSPNREPASEICSEVEVHPLAISSVTGRLSRARLVWTITSKYTWKARVTLSYVLLLA